MKMDAMVRSQSVPLPEEILKRKWAGDLEGAIRAIDARLACNLPQMLRDRLMCEKERIRRLPTQYPWNRTQAMAKLRELAGDVTDEQFDSLEDAGVVDFIYLHGEKRYFVRFHRSLMKLPQFAGQHPENAWLDPMIDTIRREGRLARRITIESSLTLVPQAFQPGEYLAQLPFPMESDQQRQTELLTGDPDGVASADAPARAAWWRRHLTQWQDFRMSYRYVSEIRYADPLHVPAPAQALYPAAAPVSPDDLAEEAPFLRFTPYLRALAAHVTEAETEPVRKAWKIYEFVTTRVQYSFVRDYFQIDDLGEFCAVNLRGDCGLQALLFILLCRISSIPARWQSGLSIDTDYVGCHDWAQFYLDGWGWLFADPSYGGSAWRNGATKRHAFYFGNIDPMRMAANRRFEAALPREMDKLRVDPYDNQAGELERIGEGEAFTGRELDNDLKMIACEDL